MSVIKKLASETALYGISSILGRLLNYALVPLHTAAFTRPSQHAVIISLFAFVSVLNVLYTYGMETAYFRYASREKDRADDYFNLAQTAIICTSVLFSGLLIVFDTPIINWLDYPNQELYLDWFAVIIAIDAIVAIPFARLRLEKKAKAFVKARMVNIAINVALNYFFIWLAKGIVEGRFLNNLQGIASFFYSPTIGIGYTVLANLMANLAFFWLLKNSLLRFRFRFHWLELKTFLVYGYPIFIMGLAGVVNLMTDRFLLGKLLPIGFYPGQTAQDALGVYGNCYKLSIFMSLVIQAFRYAAEPFFFSKAQDRNAPSVFADVMKWFVIFCVLVWVGVSLNLDIISTIFIRSQKFLVGLGVVPVLLLGNLLLGIYYNLSAWFKLSDKTYFGTLITIVGALANVLLNYLLIPQLGYMGCAWAFAVSCLLMVVLCYYFGEKHYPIPYPVLRIGLYLASAGVLIWGNAQIKISDLWLAVPYHLALCLLFVAGVALAEVKNLGKRGV